jgi:hypothetical protein
VAFRSYDHAHRFASSPCSVGLLFSVAIRWYITFLRAQCRTVMKHNAAFDPTLAMRAAHLAQPLRSACN